MKIYDNREPAGWFISEKLDGVACIWDGRNFISRNGKIFEVPQWFYDGMPQCSLVGELWAGRGGFQKVLSAVARENPVDSDWRPIKFCVFEIPQGVALPAHCAVVEQIACSGRAHLDSLFSEICNGGGEGIVLRRGNETMKLKPQADDEARIIGRELGSGRNSNRLGALVCSWAGKIFRIGAGLDDSLRDCPPKIGARVTFAFSGLTDEGIPRHPVFKCVRNYE